MPRDADARNGDYGAMKRMLGAVVAALLLATGLATGLAAPAAAYVPEPPRRPSMPAPATHHAYVAILKDAGPYDGLTDEDLGDLVRQARNYWTTEAGDAITEFPVTVRTFVRAHPDDACEPDYGGGGAMAAAEALYPDVDFTQWPNHLVVIVPDECRDDGDYGSHMVGWASSGVDIASGGQVVVDAEWEDPVRHLVQLFGTNFGLGGTDVARECNPPDPDSCGGPGPVDDLYSPMAWPPTSHPVALGTASRAQLGLVDESESPVVELAQDEPSVTAHYRIAPRGSDSEETGRRSVTVVDPENGRRYYVDYRSGTARDAGAAYVDAPPSQYTSFGTGITVTSVSRVTELWPVETGWGDEYYGYHSYRAAWQPGETFTSLEGAVEVTVDDIEPGEWADITVTVATDAVPFDAPSAPELTFAPPNDPAGPQPDCRDDASLWWDFNDWPPDTFFEIYWYADGRRAYEYADPGVGTFVRLNSPCLQGQRIQVEITARAPGHRALTAYSNVIGPVTHYYPGDVAIVRGEVYPTRSEAGRRLTAYAQFHPDPPWLDFPLEAESYQWFADGDAIAGATGKHYTPTDDDVAKAVTVRAARDDPGYDRTVFVSPPVTIDPSQFAKARPSLTGTPRVGEVLRAETAGWSPGTTFTYSWQRDGRTVPGARDARYRLAADDLGADVRVVVEGTLSGYTPVERTSDAARVARGLLATEVPRIRGRTRVGRRLVAVPGAWTPGTTFTYQWLVGEREIPGATRASYVVPRRMAGKRLRVRILGTLPGYGPETLLSEPTAKVRPARR